LIVFISPFFRRPDAIKILNESFKLQVLTQAEAFLVNPNQIVFRNGLFEYKKINYFIDELVIDDRRIIIKMTAPSEIIDQFFTSLKDVLSKIDIRQNRADLAPLLTTYETTCICKLDIDLSKYFSNSLFNEEISSSILSQIDSHGSKLVMNPYTLRFRLEYLDIPPKLRRNKIALSDKFLTIEYRERTDPSDQIFFTSSPSQTKAHFAILESLEKAFNSAKQVQK
jgi:hypothetical protein